MKRAIVLWLLSTVLSVLSGGLTQAEQHRATHLGNPATRFASPLSSPEDLRARFRDERLQPDFAAVLHQWGWKGKLADLHHAAQTAAIEDVAIPVGTLLPFMSSRESGKPICLRNVLWAGPEAAPAYAFRFTSEGRVYRCLTPKACSNFLVEDLGPEPVSALVLECHAPAQVLAGRPVQVCLVLQNSGTASEARATVRLSIPHGFALVRASDNGVASESTVTWELPDFRPKQRQELCAVFAAPEPGVLTFDSTANGLSSAAIQTTCATTVSGIAAILIDAVDLEDPVEVGKEVVYVIKVTNQGSAPGTNIRLACTLPPGEEFVSGGGITPMELENSLVVTQPLATLAPKAVAEWRAVVKATRAGDARFRIELTSDQFQRPILEEESTLLY